MKEFDNVWALCEEVSKMVDTFVRNNMTNTNAENLGLDSRAGYSLFVGDNCIAVHKSNDSKPSDGTWSVYNNSGYFTCSWKES